MLRIDPNYLPVYTSDRAISFLISAGNFRVETEERASGQRTIKVHYVNGQRLKGNKALAQYLIGQANDWMIDTGIFDVDVVRSATFSNSSTPYFRVYTIETEQTEQTAIETEQTEQTAATAETEQTEQTAATAETGQTEQTAIETEQTEQTADADAGGDADADADAGGDADADADAGADADADAELSLYLVEGLLDGTWISLGSHTSIDQAFRDARKAGLMITDARDASM